MHAHTKATITQFLVDACSQLTSRCVRDGLKPRPCETGSPAILYCDSVDSYCSMPKAHSSSRRCCTLMYKEDTGRQMKLDFWWRRRCGWSSRGAGLWFCAGWEQSSVQGLWKSMYKRAEVCRACLMKHAWGETTRNVYYSCNSWKLLEIL